MCVYMCVSGCVCACVRASTWFRIVLADYSVCPLLFHLVDVNVTYTTLNLSMVNLCFFLKFLFKNKTKKITE